MANIQYTPSIIAYINKGEKLKAMREACDLYGINFSVAGKMINSYKQGDNFYSTTEETSSATCIESTSSPTVPSGVLQIACPNCGSTLVHKSIGGKAEHVAAWGATKLAKSALLGDYGKLTGGAENEIIKDEVPFQQVCDYCHQTFHASQSKMAAGAYSMDVEKAQQLTEAYNEKLQVVKDDEVEEIREKASKDLRNTAIGAIIFTLGIFIYSNCEHTREGLFGMTEYTWPYMISWVIMFVGGVVAIFAAMACYSSYSDASKVENMSISHYARNHKA